MRIKIATKKKGRVKRKTNEINKERKEYQKRKTREKKTI